MIEVPSWESAVQRARLQLQSTSDTAALDAELLVMRVTGVTRTQLKTWPERQLTQEQHLDFESLLRQRAQGQPMAYILGEREFWSRSFKVTADTLIPRPDTELLIALALARLPQDRPFSLLDLGTGSGILAVTLALERPLAQIYATDRYPATLRVARENAERLGAGNVNWLISDWFAEIPSGLKFDCIISNPPYIAEDDPHLQQGDLRYEPTCALSSPEDGLSDLRRIINQARHFLEPCGQLLLEHGYNQAAAVHALLKKQAYIDIQHHTDLAGNDRATSACLSTESKVRHARQNFC